MTTESRRVLLHAYIDRELDAASTVEFDSHLAASASLRDELARLSALSSALQSGATRYSCPPELADRLFAALPASQVRAKSPGVPRWWRNFALGATAAALALTLWNLSIIFTARDSSRPEEIVSAHIRSLMANHLTDLESAERHSVKPWLSNRLNFAPPVHDLSKDGFLLVGGRLEYLDGNPAAAVVYRYRQHVINVFVWPAPERSDSSIRSSVQRGYNFLAFESGGMNYRLVSDLNPVDLGKLAGLLRSQPATK